jgi:hypothetical protein
MKIFAVAIAAALMGMSTAAATSTPVSDDTIEVQVFAKDGTLLINARVAISEKTVVRNIREVPYIQTCYSNQAQCETAIHEAGVSVAIERVKGQLFTVDIRDSTLEGIKQFQADNGQVIELPQSSLRQVKFTTTLAQADTLTRATPGGGEIRLTLNPR